MSDDSAGPRFDKAALRTIGFAMWNPIGVGVPEDEYDTYLMKAAGDLWNGQSIQSVANYLVWAETEQMGLPLEDGVAERAVSATAALEEYVRGQRVGSR
jgi:hypothetical protein